MKRVLGWVLCGALSLGVSERALACAFHGYTPNPTLIDVLLATEQIVIARQDPSDPQRYIPIEALAGPDVTEIPIAVTPSTRALLAGRSSATILLARDGAYGPWLEIAILDARYRAFVTKVLHRQSELLLGNNGQRLRLFAELLNDPNPHIRRLALQELDRAPYGDLKALRLPDIQNLRQDLATGEADLIPIRALLAGLSRDRSYTPLLSAELDAAVRDDLPYLGAYATAIMELEGPPAVQDLLDHYVAPTTLSPVIRERFLQAMAIQYKTAPRATRNLISREVAALSRSSPELKEMAARQFGFRGRGAASNPTSTGQSRAATGSEARR